MAAVPCSQVEADHAPIALGPRHNDLSGRSFGRLTCLYPVALKKGVVVYLCRCDCARLTLCRAPNLRAGTSKSCGCMQKERALAAVVKHGRHNDPVYGRWAAMVQRCTSPNNYNYYKYGARGITVCDRWMSFEAFIADMGEPPPGMTLERIDNDGPYCPENCRWATPKEQAFNTRKFYGATKLTRDGETKSLREWSEHLGIKLGTLYWRLERGWPEERVLTTTKWGVQR